METVLDLALASTAISGGSWLDFGQHCERIGSLFGMALTETGTTYMNSRGFTELQVLLGINRKASLEVYLQSLDRLTLVHLINRPDARSRTPLMWAVEFGWSDATQTLLDYGADPHLPISLPKDESTLLHVAAAGPSSQFARNGFNEVIDILTKAGVDVNAKDHEGWTSLHIAASWGTCTLKSLIAHRAVDWKTDG
jgi:ankyrin repeat protein